MNWQHSGLVTVGVTAETPRRPSRAVSDVPRLALVAVGAGAFAASLTILYEGMREVLAKAGGFCASGGPYVIAQHCPPGSARSVAIGMIGLFVAGAVFAGATAWMEGPTLGAGLLMWSATFGSLGYNFLEVKGGSIVSGVVFELMALGGLIPVVAMTSSWLRRRGQPEGPVFPDDNIVRAVVRPTPVAPPGSQS